MAQLDYFSFTAEIWLYSGQSAWHFVTLPQPISAAIKDLYIGIKRGFGSIRVEVTCQSETWQTSIFPDNKRGAYLLPIKKSILKKLQLATGQNIAIKLKIKASLW